MLNNEKITLMTKLSLYEDIMRYDIDQESRKLLEEGHKYILQSECYRDYGYPSFIERYDLLQEVFLIPGQCRIS